MYGYVYKTTNLINGKIYIGQHRHDKNTIDKFYFGSGKNLKKAIKKYNIENFKCEILEWCESSEELNFKEKYWIDKLNSYSFDVGYNLTLGGDGVDNKFFTPEVRKIMSQKACSREHLPTTLNRIYIHKNTTNRCIKQEELITYLNLGYEVGKYIKPENKKAWNKGLTKETDDRVKKYVEKRNKKFKNGEAIGFCGKPVDENHNRIKFINKLNSIDKNEFIHLLELYGKCYCLSYYHFGPNRWNEICNYFNITNYNNKTWKNHGNSCNQDNHEPCSSK